jgi:SAM-dependent methyltransferase
MPDRGFDAKLIRSAYASVVDDYAATFGDDLDDVELDRRILDRVASECAGGGFVLDVGCGPAQVAGYLKARRTHAVGIDFTGAMVRVAKQRAPSLPLIVADVRALPIRTGGVAGVVAFYVLQHLPRSGLADALQEIRRVLVAGGVFAAAFHAGEGEFQVGEVTGTRFEAHELARRLGAASLSVDTVEHRDPLPHERQGDRVYVFARAN